MTDQLSALDNPVWSALVGEHRRFGIANERAVRYETDVAPFAALEDSSSARSWRDLSEITGDDTFALAGISPAAIASGWELVRHLPCYQMVEVSRPKAPRSTAEHIESLGSDDVDDMLDLIAKAEPGPFLRRTVELGAYFGIRATGGQRTLAAMAGERFAVPGWREVSAVATDRPFRGRGFANGLIIAALSDIHSRDERAFLHVTKTNPAIKVYEQLGFQVRQDFDFAVIRRDATRTGRMSGTRLKTSVLRVG
jgi:ribosomal protein S18 acetylase RimI-like enzyme